MLATNLTAAQAPAADFGDLYHQRCRIKEAVSGLTQQALIVDAAAKVLAPR